MPPTRHARDARQFDIHEQVRQDVLIKQAKPTKGADTMHRIPEPGDDIFDSRDIIERIAELESIPVIDREPEDQDELDTLYAFTDGASEVSDWRYGETFILDSYFKDYARELAEDIGAINGGEKWPLSHIDWKAAADELKVYYSEYEFGGHTYYARY